MKTKIYNARASQDITIDELPKQDNPNNSDLLVIQGASLTEATSIQQLRNKILSGSGNLLSEDLGTFIYSATRINNNNYLLMDGTQYSKLEYPDFYIWLTSKSQDIKLTFSLDTNAETFRLPNYQNTVPIIGNEDTNFYYLVDRFFTGINPDLRIGISPVYCYIKVKFEYNSSVIASPFIKSDGTISMDLDYIPTDPLDVATKKYIDNKFLNYEVPLSFSINDIGKRIPYYKNAETNPVLIALDGTKYLIADYPDFDYENQEGFTNDGVYFWYADLDLEIISTLNKTMNKSAYKLMPCFSDNLKGNDLLGDWTFNSKLIYNFLQSAKGSNFLIADGVNVYKSNEKFTILDANTYLIRKNYNSYINADTVLENRAILNFKTGRVGGTEINTLRLATAEGTATGAYLGTILGEASYLKIKPDYMVAKKQQVGSGAGGGDLLANRSVLLTGTGTFNTKQITSMDDLKSENIIVGGNAKALITLDSKLVEIDNNISTINTNIGSVDITGLKTQVDTNTTDITNIKTVNTNQDSSITTLQNQVNTNTTDIANINVNLSNKQQLLINIPILATRINSNLVQNVLLGTPTILGLTGYNVNDYITVTNNIIKLKNTSYKIVNLSGSVLANYVDANGNPVASGTRYYQVFFRRPSTVTVAGTNANDILNVSFDIKTDNTSIADCEYTFSDTFSTGTADPFNIDGFVFSISNSTANNIQTLLTRTGYAKSSFIRVRLG